VIAVVGPARGKIKEIRPVVATSLLTPDPVRAILAEERITDATTISWPVYDRLVQAVEDALSFGHERHWFDYVHTVDLQLGTTERLRRPYVARLSYTDWGDPAAPAVLCMGGIANTARRFDLLARHLRRDFRVIALDWAGRGRSGWMAETSDYSFDAHVAQAKAVIEHLGLQHVSVIGSSLGGSVGLRLARDMPQRIDRLVLNDVGPYIPVERRQRRAEAVGRHYVFRSPSDMFRRAGAAQKHDGPVDDAILLHASFHQTRWSTDEDGRIYRHDPRALLHYREIARISHDQWGDWAMLTCPVLVVHGMSSDVLTRPIIEQMRRMQTFALAHIPETGHTPTLGDPAQTALVHDWLLGRSAPDGLVVEPAVRAQRVLFT
jgi:pimeloyl-ACP methyl ester carboxylesterase